MDIPAQLAQMPQYTRMTAYERALACCQLLQQQGLAIPGWMQIRQWIGKGSANDIHRAKQEFLQRQAVHSGTGSGDDQGQMPPTLSGTLQDWWQQVQQAARQQLEQAQADWDSRQQALQDQLQQVSAALQQIQGEREQLQQALQAAEQAGQHWRAQALQAESALEAVAQRVQSWQQQQAGQQQQWQQDQAQLQQQRLEAMRMAVEGAQAFALQQIEVSRQEARHWQDQFLGLQPLLQQSQHSLQTILEQQRSQQAVLAQHTHTLQQWLQHTERTDRPRSPRPRRARQRVR